MSPERKKRTRHNPQPNFKMIPDCILTNHPPYGIVGTPRFKEENTTIYSYYQVINTLYIVHFSVLMVW